ncbi:MAG: hypothetical protein M1546_25945 [Chloroflexi bacterium]|nr:hypothetical protein [Chloroflexota bacterium]
MGWTQAQTQPVPAVAAHERLQMSGALRTRLIRADVALAIIACDPTCIGRRADAVVAGVDSRAAGQQRMRRTYLPLSTSSLSGGA